MLVAVNALGQDTKPKQLFSVAGACVQFQVKGATNIRLSRDPMELQNPGPGNVPQGIELGAGDGIKEFYWKGPCYAAASANTGFIDFQIQGAR